MVGKMLAHAADAGKHPCFELACTKCHFHFLAYRFPYVLAQPSMYAAIGNNLDVVVGQQQIDQYPVVVLGIPHAQPGKYIDSTLLRGLSRQQRRQFQRGFNRKLDLPVVLRFSRTDSVLDRIQRTCRKNPPHCGAASG